MYLFKNTINSNNYIICNVRIIYIYIYISWKYTINVTH